MFNSRCLSVFDMTILSVVNIHPHDPGWELDVSLTFDMTAGCQSTVILMAFDRVLTPPNWVTASIVNW